MDRGKEISRLIGLFRVAKKRYFLEISYAFLALESRQRQEGALRSSGPKGGFLVNRDDCPTVARDIQLDEAVKVLNIRGQTLDLVVAQAQLPQPVQPEETLERRTK